MFLQGFEESDTWFDVALRVAREFLKMHIISSDSDKIAVVFYGTVLIIPATFRTYILPEDMCLLDACLFQKYSEFDVVL
jgi:hypothetical protein